MPLGVNEQSEEIAALACEWPILAALQGGTPAMRNAKQTYLPQWPNEEPASYLARLATATLFPAFKRTVNVMASKPFAKALTLSEDTHPTIQQWAEDIDLQGVSLHSFAAEMFCETVGYGLAGVLVEYPAAAPPSGLTVASLEASGRRPYFVRVMHDQILGYKTEVVNGRVRLTQLRLAESTTEDDGGPYGTKTIPLVRVLEPGKWQVWKQTTDKNWVLDSSGTTSLADIPFVPFYGVRDGFMVGRPALLDLAYLNVKHWQSQSDQDTILHVARVPMMVAIGIDDEAWSFTVGAQCATIIPKDSDLKFVEHSGASIGAGKEALLALEEQMIQTGAELLVQKPGARTATEDANDAEGNKSDLQRMAENYEDALDMALGFMAQYASLPKGGSVSLFSDYGASTLSDASATLIKDMQMAGLLSKETALKEIQRRGFISPDLDVEDELARIEADGPPLGAQLDMMAIDAKQKQGDANSQ